jgi:outer membrane protein OmpA-like peptidoglycan-associated protein
VCTVSEADVAEDSEKGLWAFFAIALVPILALVLVFGRVGDRSSADQISASATKPTVLGTSVSAAPTAAPSSTAVVPTTTLAPTTTTTTAASATTTAPATTTVATTTSTKIVATSVRATTTSAQAATTKATTVTTVSRGSYSIQFASDSAIVSDTARSTLVAAATKIKAMPSGTRVTLIGVSDNRGNAGANAKLSRDRATSVKATLIELGAKNAIYDIVAKGEEAASDPARARRVDITFGA